MRELLIEIDSQTEAVSLACVAANALFSHVSQTRLASYQLELCLDELLNNIIEHDLGFRKGTPIRILLRFHNRVITIQIRYKSRLQDPGFWKTKRLVPEAKELPERGFGRLLVEELMDEIVQEQKDGDYLVTIKKKVGRPFTSGSKKKSPK